MVLPQVLRMPLFQLPQLITQLVNARVAITRLQQFLAAPEKPPSDYLPAAEPGLAASPLSSSVPSCRLRPLWCSCFAKGSTHGVVHALLCLAGVCAPACLVSVHHLPLTSDMQQPIRKTFSLSMHGA